MHNQSEITTAPEASIRLSVAIPTFNRNDILKANLAKLIPQLTSACELVILDNCSTIPVADTLSDLLATIPENISVRLIRHRANVGGNENILRCIEYAQGEFVWLLGDDDEPVDNAVANIFQELDEHPEALVLNMYAPSPMHSLRSYTKIVKGSAGYLTAAKFFGELIFISSMVLKVQQALPNMTTAYLWQSSHAPQLIVASMMLRPNHIAVISSREVVYNGGSTTPIELQCSPIPIALGFPTLLSASWDKNESKQIQSLLKSAQKGWITPKGVVNHLITMANQDGFNGKYLALRYFYLLRGNFFSIGAPLSFEWILFSCAWPLVVWPKLGCFFRNIAWRIFKGKIYDSSKQGSLDRG